MKVTSKIKINQTAIKAITAKAQVALEQTADLLHTKVQQAQVIPRMDGHLQGEAMFVDKSESKYGRVSIVHSLVSFYEAFFNKFSEVHYFTYFRV